MNIIFVVVIIICIIVNIIYIIINKFLKKYYCYCKKIVIGSHLGLAW